MQGVLSAKGRTLIRMSQDSAMLRCDVSPNPEAHRVANSQPQAPCSPSSLACRLPSTGIGDQPAGLYAGRRSVPCDLCLSLQQAREESRSSLKGQGEATHTKYASACEGPSNAAGNSHSAFQGTRSAGQPGCLCSLAFPHQKPSTNRTLRASEAHLV